MKRLTLHEIFIEILSAELNERALDAVFVAKLTPEILTALFALSKRHKLAHVVADVLCRYGLPQDETLAAQFREEELVALYRQEQMKHTYAEICAVFDRCGIPYIPLKGAVLRPYYPKESQRTSCDIDILVREEDLARAIEVLTARHYREGARRYHDVSLYSTTNVHLELHFSLRENIEKIDRVLGDAWQYAERAEGYRFAFSEAFLVFYIYAHMSHHFLSGGCGIRPLMDVFIMEHKMGITYPAADVLLEKASLARFAAELADLVAVLFSGKQGDEFSELLLSYIISGGAFGTEQNKIAVEKAKGNTFTYTLGRIFLPYRLMALRYPVLKRLPILLPFCWVARLLSALFGGKQRQVSLELKAANAVTAEQAEAVLQMRTRLGL